MMQIESQTLFAHLCLNETSHISEINVSAYIIFSYDFYEKKNKVHSHFVFVLID